MRFTFFLVCLLVSNCAVAQNLIKNGSFEETERKDEEVGNGMGYYDHAVGWKKICSLYCDSILSDLKVGNGGITYFNRIPRTGSLFTGFGGYIEKQAHHANYIAQELPEPLQMGHRYEIRFYVRLGLRSEYYIQEIGAHFSKEPVLPSFSKGKDRRIYGIRPQVVSDTLLREWYEWMEITGSFVAKGGERYVTIGSFSPYNIMHLRSIPEYIVEEEQRELGQDAGHLNNMYEYLIDDISLSFVEETYHMDKLKNLKTGESIIFENIYFDTGSARLLQDSKEGLESLLAIMNENPKLAIEIAGHTDNRGKADFNQQLSTKRAQAVASYLLANSIEKNRIKPKGYGATQPIADNNTMLGRQRNRRVELKVLAK